MLTFGLAYKNTSSQTSSLQHLIIANISVSLNCTVSLVYMGDISLQGFLAEILQIFAGFFCYFDLKYVFPPKSNHKGLSGRKH